MMLFGEIGIIKFLIFPERVIFIFSRHTPPSVLFVSPYLQKLFSLVFLC